jgi:hypothetical protein
MPKESPIKYVAIRHDITQRKFAEAQLLEQAAELQRATQLSFGANSQLDLPMKSRIHSPEFRAR